MGKYSNIGGAEALLLSLIEEGVTTVFGYPGGTIIPIYDTLYSYSDKLTHILTRHEQGAVHAAQGYSRAKAGEVGVCMATSGPGATNLITGIADAMVDSTPLVCITAQVPKALLGTDAFQEADMISMTMPITKWSYQITSSSEISEAIAKAFYIARSGRPGPVVLEMTKNAQVEILEEYIYTKCTSLRTYEPEPQCKVEQIGQVAELINTAQSPLMLVGNGVLISKCEKEVAELSAKADIPVATTLMGLSAIKTDNPRYIGMIGMHGTVAANVMTQKSDLIIAIGMRFSDRVTGDVKKFAPNAKIVHIDIDTSEFNKVVSCYIGVNANAKDAVEALLPLVKETSHSEWMASAAAYYAKEYEKVVKMTVYPKDETIKMGEAIHAIAECGKGSAIIVTDVGQQQMQAARYSKFTEPHSFITSGGLGTMGYGLPAAIGAKLGRPDRDVVAVLGDGGFQMTMQELGTIAQNNIGVKVVILNNSYLGMVRQWQQLFFDKRYSFTELVNPDFTKIADAYSIKSEKVCCREELQGAVQRMLEHDGAYFLEIIVENQENVFPMVPAGNSISEQMCNVNGD